MKLVAFYVVIMVYIVQQKVEGHTSAIESVAFSISEEYIAAGSKSGTTKVFDLEKDQGTL